MQCVCSVCNVTVCVCVCVCVCVGVRIDLGSVSDASAASALGHANDHVDVYSCSWGPPDTGYWWSRPGPLTLSTLLHAVQNVSLTTHTHTHTHAHTHTHSGIYCCTG